MEKEDRNGMIYMTTNEVAEFLNVTPGFVRTLRLKREGPPYALVGSRARYLKKDVIDYYNSKRVIND